MNNMIFGSGFGPPSEPPHRPSRKSEPSHSDRRRLHRLKVREKRKARVREAHEMPLKVQAVFAWLMLLVAVMTLLTDFSAEGKFKGLLIATGGALASYISNTLAIKEGAEQGAYGFHGTTVASVLAILITGGAIFTASAAGLTLKDVASVILVERSQIQADIVASRIESARRVERYVAVVDGISSDLKGLVACEVSSACISSKSAGRGDVTKALEVSSTRADQLVEQLSAGKERSVAALGAINGLLVEYQSAISSEDDVWRRWSAAGLIDARIGQTLAEVEESLPIAAVHAYGAELDAGTAIDGNPAATARLTSILKGHASRLKQVDVGEAARATLPQFPARPGVVTALSYGLMFLPVILLCFVTDLATPLCLFHLRYTKLRREIEQEFGRYPHDDDDTPADVSAAGQPLKVWPETKLVGRRAPE